MDASEIDRRIDIYIIPTFDIQMTTFIKQEWLERPEDDSQIFAGDDRQGGSTVFGASAQFGRDISRFRTRTNVKVDLLAGATAGGSTSGIFGVDNQIGTSIRYDSASSLVDGRITAAAKADSTLDDDFMKDAVATASSSGLTVTPEWLDTRKLKLTLVGSVSNPLATPSPSIDYNFVIIMDYSDFNNPTYQVSGTHDGFPCYELYINNANVYASDSGDRSPLALFGDSDQTASSNGVLVRF